MDTYLLSRHVARYQALSVLEALALPRMISDNRASCARIIITGVSRVRQKQQHTYLGTHCTYSVHASIIRTWPFRSLT